jgi:methionyl-tRNA synthetase
MGNFVNRVMVLTWKFFEGRVPSDHELPDTNDLRRKILKSYNHAHSELDASIGGMTTAIKNFRFRDAQFHMMNLSRIGNKFLAETEPWKVAKEDMEAVGCILNYALTVVGNIAMACEPFLPDGATSIHQQLNSTTLREHWREFWTVEKLIGTVPVNHQLNNPTLLYKNVEDEDIQKQMDKLSKQQKQNAPSTDNAIPPLKPEIVFDDFSKLDIRVGKVLSAEKMEKSNKLLKLTVETGLDKRTILSGIAQHYSPEDMIGKQVTFIANLAPRKMMGIESQGMILMAEDKDGKLRLILPEQAVAPGSSVS